jgi:hypothetical protein
MYYFALGIIVLELLFFVLNVKKSISGKGASGVPFLTFIAFLIVSKYLDEPIFFGTAKVELLLFALFHIFSHFIIPLILKKRWRDQGVTLDPKE